MSNIKEYLAEKVVFECFLEKVKEKGWQTHTSPYKEKHAVDYFDTEDIQLHQQGIHSGCWKWGKESLKDVFCFAQNDEKMNSYHIHKHPLLVEESDKKPEESLLSQFVQDAQKIPRNLQPVVSVEKDNEGYFIILDSEVGEEGAVQVSFSHAYNICVYGNEGQTRGSTSLSSVVIEHMNGGASCFEDVDDMIKGIISDTMSMDALEVSAAETGFDLYQKFMPQAKDNPGNYMSCDLD